jgi:hypothetical protein
MYWFTCSKSQCGFSFGSNFAVEKVTAADLLFQLCDTNTLGKTRGRFSDDDYFFKRKVLRGEHLQVKNDHNKKGHIIECLGLFYNFSFFINLVENVCEVDMNQYNSTNTLPNFRSKHLICSSTDKLKMKNKYPF